MSQHFLVLGPQNTPKKPDTLLLLITEACTELYSALRVLALLATLEYY